MAIDTDLLDQKPLIVTVTLERKEENGDQKERPFRCSFLDCDKAYTSLQHLTRHNNQKHVLPKPAHRIACPECPKTFTIESNMKRHLKRAHYSRPSFCCSICAEVFSKKRTLRVHLIAHTGNYPYVCSECGKGSLTYRAYERHLPSHSHKCDLCSRVYRHWSALVAHKKLTHASEYPCPICDRVFNARNALKQHRKIHAEEDSGLTMFQCPYERCPRFYQHQRNLKAHIQSRHEGRKFICGFDDCGRPLATKQKLREHLKLHMMEEGRVRERSSKPRRARKDKGKKKRSTASHWAGVELPPAVERMVLAGEGEKVAVDLDVLPAGSETE